MKSEWMRRRREEREKNSGIQGQLHHTTAAASSLSRLKEFSFKIFQQKFTARGSAVIFTLFTVSQSTGHSRSREQQQPLGPVLLHVGLLLIIWLESTWNVQTDRFSVISSPVPFFGGPACMRVCMCSFKNWQQQQKTNIQFVTFCLVFKINSAAWVISGTCWFSVRRTSHRRPN